MTENIEYKPIALNLEFLKKQAKAFLKEINEADPVSIERLFLVHPRVQQQPQLADAQFVIAREHGFPSWPKLKAYIESISGPKSSRFRAIDTEVSYYDDRSGGLLSQHASGLPEAMRQIKTSHPTYKHMTEDQIAKANFTIDDARLVTSIEHGCGSWQELTDWLGQVASGESIEPFQKAFVAIKADDEKTFAFWLFHDPSIVTAKGTNSNSLLSLAVSFRRLGMARLLLESGADVNAANVRGWTPLHQAAMGQIEITRMLIEFGADPALSALGDGGTPLVVALFWGHTLVADLLTAHAGVLPLNLRAAAGSGDLSLVKSFFDENGTLRPGAGDHRGFYRPHSGFPVWQPTDDPQEIINEAFVYAASSGRHLIMQFLLEHGAQIDGDPYRGTALLRAVNISSRTATVKWLVEHGADVNHRATFGGHGYGEQVTPLHVAAASNSIENAKILLSFGADPKATENVYNSDPVGWAEHFGNTELAEMIRSASA